MDLRDLTLKSMVYSMYSMDVADLPNDGLIDGILGLIGIMILRGYTNYEIQSS